MKLELIHEILKNGTLCSVAVYGVTEAIKPLIKKSLPAWSRASVRLFALCCGGAFGYYLDATPAGVLTGLCGAALSAVVVARVKAKIAGPACDKDSCE